MSFILDALKKSESERQQQAPAAFATVPSSESSPRAPRWLWLLGGLLVINFIVLLSLILRSDDEPSSAPSTASVTTDDSSRRSMASFAEQIEAAKRKDSQRQTQTAGVATQQTGASPAQPDADLSPTVTDQSATFNPPVAAPSPANLPTIYELQANGALTLPELHLDIHVYSDTPEDRFVFINMSKQRERSQLSEGPIVKEITPDGVVLEHRGTTFLLPRD